MPRQLVLIGSLAVALAAVSACSNRSSNESRAGSQTEPPERAPTGAEPAAPAAPAPARATPGFAGTFHGDIAGTRSTLAAEQRGNRLTARIDAGGYAYRLEGTVDGAHATGTVTDSQSGGTMPFEAALEGDEVRMTLAAPTGAKLALAFRRAGAPAAPPPAAGRAPGSTPAASPQRDPRLVGAWRYVEQLGDSSGSMIIEWRLVIRADGTFTYGNDRSQTRGQWRTEGNIVHANDGTGWVPYAKFTADRGSLLLVFDDGTRRLYRRM